jgi:hypothetical protein
MASQSPFDRSLYTPCCGKAPTFTKDAGIWWALCIQCGQIACAMDGSHTGLAGAWNESMKRKEDGK